MASPINPNSPSRSIDPQDSSLDQKTRQDSSSTPKELILAQGQESIEEKGLTTRSAGITSKDKASESIALISSKVNIIIDTVQGFGLAEKAKSLISLATSLVSIITETDFVANLKKELNLTQTAAIALIASSAVLIGAISTSNPIGALAAIVPVLSGIVQASKGAFGVAILIFSTLGKWAFKNDLHKTLSFCLTMLNLIDKLPSPENRQRIEEFAQTIIASENLKESPRGIQDLCKKLQGGDSSEETVIVDAKDEDLILIAPLTSDPIEEEPVQEAQMLELAKTLIKVLAEEGGSSQAKETLLKAYINLSAT